MFHAARLHALPIAVTAPAPAGLLPFEVNSSRDSYFYVPADYTPARPAPFVLLLHGAGGHSHHGLDILRHLADEHSLILAAPASARSTWDVIAENAFGTDVRIIDHALQQVFNHYAIDTNHLAIGGFSDGASYALSLGLANADLFTHILAFSPGFAVYGSGCGFPKIFIAHGVNDDVLPINPCSRKIVPRLERDGYSVTYREFDGAHVLPADIAHKAVAWFLQAN